MSGPEYSPAADEFVAGCSRDWRPRRRFVREDLTSRRSAEFVAEWGPRS
jgi:hypothetical protein